MNLSTVFDSPIGHIYLKRSELGLSECKVVDDPISPTEDAFLLSVRKQLEEYFSGERKEFSVKIDYRPFSFFTTDVYRLLQLIPYGKVRSYRDIASYLEKPQAARAIGRINGTNPIAIIIPCHRVIGTNGELTGYAYGIETKRWLLSLEKNDQFQPQAEMFNSVLEE